MEKGKDGRRNQSGIWGEMNFGGEKKVETEKRTAEGLGEMALNGIDERFGLAEGEVFNAQESEGGVLKNGFGVGLDEKIGGVVKNNETGVEIAEVFENRGHIGRMGLKKIKEEIIQKNQELNNPRTMVDQVIELKNQVREKGMN